MVIRRGFYLEKLISAKHNGAIKVITGDPYEKPWKNRDGVTIIGIMPFLLDSTSIETL